MQLNIWKKTRQAPSSGGQRGLRLHHTLAQRRLGAIQRYGELEMIPVFGAPATQRYAPPQRALRLVRAHTYGKLEFANDSDALAIVPLHIGYLQKGAQNHALCSAWMLAANSTHCFDDACCIQAAQGGLITDMDERFIFLPHPLRKKAFALRGQAQYSKLWDAIAKFNQQIGLSNRGHLDELKQNRQAELMRWTHALECEPEQTGALFLFRGQWVGLEIAPDADYYAGIHEPLVMYTYAPLAYTTAATTGQLTPRLDLEGAGDIAELIARYRQATQQRTALVESWAQHQFDVAMQRVAAQQLRDHTLYDMHGNGFSGQAVYCDDTPVYVSLFETRHWAVA